MAKPLEVWLHHDYIFRSLLSATISRKRPLTSGLASSVYRGGGATKPSAMIAAYPNIKSGDDSTLKNIRKFQEHEVIIDKTNVLGEGVFGKCYLSFIGPQNSCIKVVRKNPLYEKSFVNEAHILSYCCNRNVTFLYGIMSTSRGYNCLILCYHSFHEKSCSIHGLLNHKHVIVTVDQWRRLLVGIAKGLKYLHNHEKGPILHNDLKNDNVVVDEINGQVGSIIIDFGKACFEKNAKLYDLSIKDRERYKIYHPQVAPDVRDGIHKQSVLSDVYSYGRIMLSMNEKLSLPAISSMANLCLKYNADDRPKANELYISVQNLLS